MAIVRNTIKFSSGGGSDIIVVANYSALPDPTTVSGQFYWCSASQGTSWLPGSLGGTYYNSGMYYSNGTTWEFLNVPYNATQSEVNAGTNNDKFVTPKTFADASKWNDFLAKSTIVSSNTTASNDTNYTVVANTTFTDPSPIEGKGYITYVRNGTATIGGIGYGVGKLIYRTFHSGSWNTVVFIDQTALDAKVEDAIVDGVTTIAPSQNAVFDALDSKADTDSTFPMRFQFAASSPLDNATYFCGGSNNLLLSLTNNRFVYAGITASTFRVSIFLYNTGTLGTSENSTIKLLNVTQGTNIVLTTTAKFNSLSYGFVGNFTFAVTEGDSLALEINCPAFATNPTGLIGGVNLILKK